MNVPAIWAVHPSTAFPIKVVEAVAAAPVFRAWLAAPRRFRRFAPWQRVEMVKANPPAITNEPAAQFNDAARPDPRPEKESRSARIMREMQERQAKGRDRDDFDRER